MRQLKFRVWDKKEKAWVKDFALIQVNGVFKACRSKVKNEWFGHGDYRETVEVQNEYYPLHLDAVVQQFTGSVDCNGVEIYEGDILSFATGPDATVEWRDENDSWDFSGWSFEDRWDQGGGRKVVGNIFENEH